MTVQLKIGNENIPINIIWLRDNCRCSECYDHDYNSRKTTTQQFLKTINIKIQDYTQADNNLCIKWSDGHKSEYHTKWVIDIWTRKKIKIEPNLCFGEELEKLPSKVSYNNLTLKECLKELMESILKYGVGIITNVEPTLEATEKLVRFIAQPQETVFGTMWTVGNHKNHKDPSYLNGPLIVHNDSTYFNESTGLQVFHMFERDINGKGGFSTIVDGFKAAEILKKENPSHFKNLTEIEIESEYIEPGFHYKCKGPVIKIDPTTNEVYQIRFNIYDRSPLPPSRVNEFYKSYAHFLEILEREEMCWKHCLKPGTVIIYNNWRILHGRTSFTGKRIFGGCYISMTEFLSKARILQLI
ncbi:trimethyllysine dioxygenase, mitochondrial [Melanaphis sacchari]|uniref:Trimethyllysine dioxygenase, mitochondrial n=1 Tax=Melanaphis sacchari TaxID=742174 RepID=A0A2H8TW57_9HEMI|nr:trimethyllysine dioxygenase, mitochondrial [Melanaphis sacchari]